MAVQMMGGLPARDWNKTTIIQGVPVFQNTDPGTMYFQTGRYTFKFFASRYSRESPPPLLLKAGSALINALAPPAK